MCDNKLRLVAAWTPSGQDYPCRGPSGFAVSEGQDLVSMMVPRVLSSLCRASTHA